MRFLQKLFVRAFAFYPQPSDSSMRRAAYASNLWPTCDCFPFYDRDNLQPHELRLHDEIQNTNCDAWKFLENLVQKAIKDRSREFAPGLEMPREMWAQIVTLPRSIAKLTSVRRLYLYRSHLVRIPVEIGEMTNLREFDAYTSYRLHWLPFEITRCKKLKQSRISTRALYGNYKYRSPFPRFETVSVKQSETNCSVCNQKLPGQMAYQVWISLRVATDVIPLLVNACSEECIRRLPPPANGYIDHPHRGGLEVSQPGVTFSRPQL